jgi:hypothetical protein
VTNFSFPDERGVKRMQTKELFKSSLDQQGISVEVVGDAIYRFSQFQCEVTIPQHVIHHMLAENVESAATYITRKLFYLIRRIED